MGYGLLAVVFFLFLVVVYVFLKLLFSYSIDFIGFVEKLVVVRVCAQCTIRTNLDQKKWDLPII